MSSVPQHDHVLRPNPVTDRTDRPASPNGPKAQPLRDFEQQGLEWWEIFKCIVLRPSVAGGLVGLGKFNGIIKFYFIYKE